MRVEQIIGLALALGVLLIFIAIFGMNESLKRQGI
jgi:amino acid transporter